MARFSILWLVATLTIATPSLARADWLRAESERFIVYSDGGERALREYVQKLETFDRVLRYRSGFPLEEAPTRKLPIYLVGSRAGLLKVHPQARDNVVGTYFPTEEDVFAVAIRGEDDQVLLHEYAHHFMLGNLAAAYPGWFVEGFAEYYMTADIEADEVTIGLVSENRAYWLLNGSWLPLEVLLESRPSDVTRSGQRNTYYPLAWLLTHWFFSDDERRSQRDAYLRDIAAGANSVEAMEKATGLSLDQLRVELRRYSRASRLSGRRLVSDWPAVEVRVERLPRSANDLLLLGQRLKIGVPDEDREALGAEVLRLAGRHGDDPFALLTAGHAGLHFGHEERGEQALVRLLEIAPDHVEGLQYLASHRLKQADEHENDADRSTLQRQARELLSRAYAAENNNYRTLVLLAELRSSQPNYPNDNDMLALGLAFDRVPQLSSVRFNYAAALVARDQDQDAIAVLTPLANNPHAGGASEAAEQMIEALKAGEAPPPPPVVEGPTEPATPPEDAPAT